ncbi:MAG: hypothetical protein JO246_13660 [Frankiaceae bacterium]|nr:hypothetical protein [Frankiaceae bacterium]MBV9871152.1 hypothetical protein [Frankiaceae bacterium]
MTNHEHPDPKTSEVDPPAADGPVSEGTGGPEPVSGEAQDQAGRAANDPSLSQDVVPEVVQAPPGKPDGEVDTAFRRQDPPVERRL